MLARILYKVMSEHKVTVKWERGGADFSYQRSIRAIIFGASTAAIR